MSVQRRPLTGMVLVGSSAPRAVTNVASVVVHTVDLTTAAGGPFVDVVTLIVQNSTGAPIIATVTALGGTSIVQSVPANGSVVIFDQMPFQAAAGSTGGASQIVAQGAAGGLVFFGWFARPL